MSIALNGPAPWYAANGPGLWYATRATGMVTLLLLTLSILLGIMTAGRFASEKWPRFLTVGLHRNTTLLVVVFLALHVGTTVLDRYTSIPAAAAVIPFASPYKAPWLGLGAVAADLLIAVMVTSLLRGRLGFRAWRILHWLGYVCWPVALIHALGTGTDRRTLWGVAAALCCIAAVAVAATWRLATAARAGAR
jgi:methionine sulfoxide reductase heme-binding subunit